MRNVLSPLLITKLYIPQAKTAHVLRLRLVDRLQQGLARQLTLVSAPAGFGKTTLLCDWLRSCELPTAWVSLDKGDNDPARFWSYVTAALQTVYIAAGQSIPNLLNTPDLPPIEVFLVELINDLAGQKQPFILALDDYHVIETRAIHDGMLFLLEHAPASFHFVIASRADPPWPLARLRARDQLTELRAADLRFTLAETVEFLNHIVQLDLTPEDITALEDRTEGWIAGLQMVALSLQGRARAHQFITAFTGSNRFIFDYLVEEVLQRQPAEVQEFLLKTSLLERFNAALCNAVLDQNNSQEILAKLDRANLFIVPLDDTRCWYRYHHLFASLLRSRLEQTWREALPTLNCKASVWCEQAGLIEEAVFYAQASGDLPFLVGLLEKHILPTIALGEFSLARHWLDSLPEGKIQSHAILCVAQGWITPIVDRASLQRAEQWMNAAEAALRRLDSPPAHTQNIVVNNLAAFRVMQVRFEGQPAQDVIQLCLQALDFVADQNHQIRSLLFIHLGGCYLEIGNTQAANQAFNEALRLGIASQNHNAAFMSINARLMQSYWRAEFTEALRIGQESLAFVLRPLEQAGWHPPDSAVTYAVLGMILLERNDLVQAREYLYQALDLFPKLGPTFLQARCYLALARVLHTLGGIETIPDLSRLGSAYLPEFSRLFAAYQACIELLKATSQAAFPTDFIQAIHWANQFQTSFDEQTTTLIEALALARVRLTQFQVKKTPIHRSELQTILDLLTEKLEEARQRSQNLNMIEVQIQRARLFYDIDQRAEAAVALGEALHLSEPEGIVRPFLDEGEPLQFLLADLRSSIEHLVEKRPSQTPISRSNSLPGFIDSLLAGSSYQFIHMHDLKPKHDFLIQPLSERELEILRLLNTSLNSSEIAARLYISVSTVRTHIKNIYAKLNVNRRIEAVQRAAELGLI